MNVINQHFQITTPIFGNIQLFKLRINNPTW